MKQELRYPERGEAVFICDVPDQAKKPVESIPEDRIKGGDLGLERFLTLSEGSLPNYPTTQFCHSCLEWVPKDLSERQHRCPNCGVDLPRDENSALLIKRLSLTWPGYAPGRGVKTPMEHGPLPSLRGLASLCDEAGSSWL
jgi:transposase